MRDWKKKKKGKKEKKLDWNGIEVLHLHSWYKVAQNFKILIGLINKKLRNNQVNEKILTYFQQNLQSQKYLKLQQKEVVLVDKWFDWFSQESKKTFSRKVL